MYVFLAVILFCFVFFHSFCLFLFSYFEIRFNIFASIYVIIIFIDSLFICINIYETGAAENPILTKERSFCGLGRNQDFGEEK